MFASVSATATMSTFAPVPTKSCADGPSFSTNVPLSTDSSSIGVSYCSIRGLSRKEFKTLASIIFREVRTPLHNAVLAVQNIVSEESFPLTTKVLVEWEALCDSLTKISRVLNDITDSESEVSDISEGSSIDSEPGAASEYHSARSTPEPSSPTRSDEDALQTARIAPVSAPDAESPAGFSGRPSPSGASSQMIVRNVTCDRDLKLNRNHLKRSRSLGDDHLLPAQGTSAAAHTALSGRSFADKAVGRDVPRRPALVRRGTSDISGILKRWRLSAALPPSSRTLGFTLPSPFVAGHPIVSKKTTSTMEQGKGLHVLVCDDDILTVKLMERSLRRMGCTVDTAENGKVALEMIASTSQVRSNWSGMSGSYDIVFLDNQMPVMSGLDAVTTLRSFRRGDLVIGVTGNALLSDRQEFLSAGADHVLTKPVFEGNLVEVIRVAQERRLQLASS